MLALAAKFNSIFTVVTVYCYWIASTTAAAGMLLLYCEWVDYHGGTTLYVVSCTAAITKSPVSVTALVGTNAQFHCAGTGNYLVWIVDGLAHHFLNILERGIIAVTLSSSGTVMSNLTVPATSENNGTTVRCAIGISQFSYTAISNYSTLTVLPGEITSIHTLNYNKVHLSSVHILQ